MQGQLRKEYLSVLVETECGHCQRPLRLEIDSSLNFRVLDEGTKRHPLPQPLIYAPMVDLHNHEDPSIIDRF